MIIRQATTIVFEYPQDYLQEQEWCKTKEDRWIHKGTDTLGAVYENTISYSIGQPNNSEETNNSTISKMEQVDKDINVRSKDCETCKHYKLACELFSEVCKYEPITQTETQNSNLTFKTLEYCDICDHKGCEECIANALDEHCIPSQFKKQIEDECAKEYEELGLKELKELIEADRKTENSSEIPNNCKVKNYCDDCLYTDTCDSKEFFYACTSKATISKMATRCAIGTS